MSGAVSTSAGGVTPVLFAPICKIDEEQRMVFGYATTPTRDQSGEVITLDAVKKALPEYLDWGCVRQMHQPSAVGTAVEATIDGKGLWFGAYVQDDQAWAKCKPTKLADGTELPAVYKGFSVGGRITDRDPDDKRTVTGIDLVEISLVDRPCNPDARIDIVKADGAAPAEPLAKFLGCGPEPLGKAGHRLYGGTFATRDALRQEVLTHAAEHDAAAEKAEQAATHHRTRRAAAETGADAVGITVHSHLADANAALAEHHRNAARNYRRLAASLASGGSKEVQMPDNILAEAEAALAKMTAAISSANIEGITALTEIQAAHGRAVEEDAAAIAAIAAATQARATANAKRADGDKDQAKHADAEAEAHETAAQHHHDAAQSYHDLVAERIKTVPSDSAHGANEDGNLGKAAGGARIALCKAAADHCTAHAEKCGKAAGEYDAFAERAKTDSRTEDAAGHAKFAGTLRQVADARKAMAKSFTDAGLPDLAQPTQKRAVKPLAKLTKSADGTWLDKHGVYFGKRDFTDKQRQDAADAGHAMEDGSFPIETEADLEDAVSAFGRAKDKDKAKAHITAQAKRLKATDKLPEDWPGSTKKKGGTATKGAGVTVDQAHPEPHPQQDNAVLPTGESEADRRARKLAKAARKAKKLAKAARWVARADRLVKVRAAQGQSQPLAKAAKTCPACHAEIKDGDTKCAACGGALTKAATMHKSMGFIASLASTLTGIRSLQHDYQREQSAEGDTDPDAVKLVEQLHEWLASGIKLLEDVVAREATEFGEGKDVERIWTGDSNGPQYVTLAAPTWMRDLAGVLRARAEKPVPKDVRKLRKALADSLDKAAPEMERLATADRPTATGTGSGSQAPAATTTTDPRSEKLLRSIVGQVAPLVKATQDMRASLTTANVEIATLKSKIAKLEGEPVVTPLRHASRPAGSAVTKTADGGAISAGGGATDPAPQSALLQKVLAVPAGPERADALLREAYLSTSK
jgi:hypothetical protein